MAAENKPQIEPFEIFDEVYLRRSSECIKGVVLGINIRPGPYVTYCVAWSDKREEHWHHAIELSREWIPEFKVKS